MAQKKIGVVVIHGIGSQGVKKPDKPDTITFSKEMHKRVMKGLGGQKMEMSPGRRSFGLTSCKVAKKTA